jgi:hypothetical protein
VSQQAFLKKVISALDDAGIPYMVCGSLGSSFHGEPRATMDVDVVIDPAPDQLGRFLDRLGTDFYASRPAAEEAVANRSMFNVIDNETGWKADLIIRKKRPFSETEFARRSSVDVEGLALTMATPEDVILSKLEWSARAESERQYRDALGVARTQGGRLDRAYLEKWASALGVARLLARLFEDAASDS